MFACPGIGSKFRIFSEFSSFNPFSVLVYCFFILVLLFSFLVIFAVIVVIIMICWLAKIVGFMQLLVFEFLQSNVTFYLLTLFCLFVKDFQSNFERYRVDFDSLLRQSEDLDQDAHTGSNYKTRLDDNMSRVRQLWSSVLKRADEHKEQVGRQNERLKEFQGLSSALIKWMDGIETHSGFTVPSSASIQQMKVHFEHVKVIMLKNKSSSSLLGIHTKLCHTYLFFFTHFFIPLRLLLPGQTNKS